MGLVRRHQEETCEHCQRLFEVRFRRMLPSREEVSKGSQRGFEGLIEGYVFGNLVKSEE